MDKTLELEFKTTLGKEKVITISDLREDVTKEQADAAMATIVGTETAVKAT